MTRPSKPLLLKQWNNAAEMAAPAEISRHLRNLLPPGTVRQQALVSELLDCSAQQMRFFLGMNANSGHKSVEAMIIWVVNTFFTIHWTTSHDPKAASPKTVKGIPKFAAASRKTCINPHPCIRVEA